MKNLLVVLEAGDSLPSGIIRGLAYEDLFAQSGLQAKFIARRPVSWFETKTLGLRKLLSFPPIKNRLMSRAIALSEKRIRKLALTADIIYLNKVSVLLATKESLG
jgi:hypothetical protein